MLDLVSRRGDRLTIAPQGPPYARSIPDTLDPYRERNQMRFSSVV